MNVDNVLEELQRRKKQSLLEKAEADKRKIRKIMSPTDILSITYTPFIIAEVAWDYADTLIDLSVIQRRHETKKLCRKIRQLRTDYNNYRFKIINEDWRYNEIANMIVFQDSLNDVFSSIYTQYKQGLQETYQIDEDTLSIVATAHVASTIIKALYRYAEAQEMIVASILGYAVSSLVPQQIKQLNMVINEYIGKYSLTEDMAKQQKEFVEQLAHQIVDSKFTVDGQDTN